MDSEFKRAMKLMWGKKHGESDGVGYSAQFVE